MREEERKDGGRVFWWDGEGDKMGEYERKGENKEDEETGWKWRGRKEKMREEQRKDGGRVKGENWGGTKEVRGAKRGKKKHWSVV